MNFYSHVAVASLFGSDPKIALGSMLPDFASLIGAKPPKANCPRISRGYELHHATDRVFHDSETFRRSCAFESRLLQSLGFARGTSMAAAHVGLELILDDALSEDEPTQSLFGLALVAAAPGPPPQSVDWATPDQAARFEALRLRLWSVSVPKRPSDAATIAERLCRTLSHRPRLAVRASDRDSVESWVAELALRSRSFLPDLVGGVVRELEKASWRPHVVRELRFRRA